MAYKSALDIIRESLPPEEAAKFHSGSRKPFDYEAPVIEAAKEAMAGRRFKSKIELAFPANGRELFESEKPAVEAFKAKYKGLLNGKS